MHWEDPEELGGEGGGGESGWGIHVNPWLIHVNVWQNPLKCCEVISLQLIKINEKILKKDIQDLNGESYKSVLKDIKDINKWENTPH